MLKRFALILAMGVLVLGALAACGGSSDNNDSGSSGSSGGGKTVTVDMTEMKFTPSNFTVKAGEKVTVTAKNTGSVVHDFVIDNPSVKIEVDPGKSKTESFTAPSSPGTIEFYCSQPGHKQAGMHGTITVQ